MAALTLPIVVGKKYVRRDGAIVEATKPFDENPGWMWFSDDRSRVITSGDWLSGADNKSDLDIVSDYIEPAKGHPHGGERCYGFKVGVKYVFTKPLAIPPGGLTADQVDQYIADGFGYESVPDPHAENAAEYAKDMALSDKAWEGWECRDAGTLDDWTELYSHPAWGHDTLYRRKEQS